jgi:UDP-N-acetylmuramoylalanine--D-glutamate ligase
VIAATSFKDRDVGVFGLRRTGHAATEALRAGGAKVYAWDDEPAQRALARQAGATDVNWQEWPWPSLSALVLSPGVPLTHPSPHPVVLEAKQAGVKVIGDFELFAREVRPAPGAAGQAPVIAVTGTNGKSTTTALIGHILAQSGVDAQVGGNIGKSVVQLEPPGPKSVYVLETSSFQIDLAPGFSPDTTLLLNLSPDHIDRHGSMQNYAGVKERLIKQTARDGQAIIGVDDDYSAAIFSRASARGIPAAVPVSVGKVLGRGIFVVDGILYDALSGRAEKMMDLSAVRNLPGAHNWQNAAFAYAATKRHVRDSRAIIEAMVSFPGLAHRMENLGAMGRVRFINDSKATNAEAAERALACYSDIFWIAGGRSKEGGIESLVPHFDRIRKAYLIGEAAEIFAATLSQRVPFEISGTLKDAVAHAAADAARSLAAEPVVLLSPACASFDQFADFEARGAAFREAVAQLAPHPVKEAS